MPAIKRSKLDAHRVAQRASIRHSLRVFCARHGRMPLKEELGAQSGMPTASKIDRVYRNYTRALIDAGFDVHAERCRQARERYAARTSAHR